MIPSNIHTTLGALVVGYSCGLIIFGLVTGQVSRHPTRMHTLTLLESSIGISRTFQQGQIDWPSNSWYIYFMLYSYELDSPRLKVIGIWYYVMRLPAPFLITMFQDPRIRFSILHGGRLL